MSRSQRSKISKRKNISAHPPPTPPCLPPHRHRSHSRHRGRLNQGLRSGVCDSRTPPSPACLHSQAIASRKISTHHAFIYPFLLSPQHDISKYRLRNLTAWIQIVTPTLTSCVTDLGNVFQTFCALVSSPVKRGYF